MIFLIKFLLLLTAFLTPIMGVTKNFSYEQSKVFFFIVLTSLSGFVWLFYLMRKPRFKWSGMTKAAGLFILMLLITSFTGSDPTHNLLGSQPYFQGVILYAYLFLFFLLVKASTIKFDHWVWTLVLSSTLVGTLAIKDWVLINILGQPIPTYAGRVVSTFGQPNFYAGFLLLTLPFSYLLFKDQNKKLQLLGWGSGIISYLGIIVSYSRSAIFLSLFLLILGLIDQLKIRKLLAGVVAVLIIAVFLSVSLSSGFVWKEFLNPINTVNPDLTRESVENRVYIWPIAWQLVLLKPLTGYGLENINQAFPNYFQTNYHSLFEANSKIQPVLISLKELNIDRSHNYLLDLLLFSGVLGLLSWLLMIALISRKLIVSKINPKTTTMLIGFSLYLVWVQFQNQSIVHLVYFWLLVGIIDQDSY